jgi:hypothetical protein
MAFSIRATIIGETGTTLRVKYQTTNADSFRPDYGGNTFPRNVGFYESHLQHIPEDGILHNTFVKT